MVEAYHYKLTLHMNGLSVTDLSATLFPKIRKAIEIHAKVINLPTPK